MTDTQKKLLWILLSMYLVLNLLQLFLTRKDEHQHQDFFVYHASVTCQERGLNPYDETDVSRVNERKSKLKYVYPPVSLKLFKAFHFDEKITSAKLFLTFKILLFFWVFLIWRKLFRVESSLFFLTFSIFVFECTVFKDLYFGNIGIVVAFLIWQAIFFYTRGRFFWASLFIVAASIQKILPIFFLMIFLFNPNKKKIAAMLFGSVLFAIYLVSNYLLHPTTFFAFFSAAADTMKDYTNHSLFKFLETIVEQFSLSAFNTAHQIVTVSLFVIVNLLIIIKTVQTFQKTKRHLSHDDTHIFFLCFLMLIFTFLTPRIKPYDFVMLIPVSFWAIMRIVDSRSSIKKAWIFLPFLFALSDLNLPQGMETIRRTFIENYSFILTLIVWTLLLWHLERLHLDKSQSALQEKTSSVIP